MKRRAGMRGEPKSEGLEGGLCAQQISPRAAGRARAAAKREGGEGRGQWERAPGGRGAREGLEGGLNFHVALASPSLE